VFNTVKNSQINSAAAFVKGPLKASYALEIQTLTQEKRLDDTQKWVSNSSDSTSNIL